MNHRLPWIPFLVVSVALGRITPLPADTGPSAVAPEDTTNAPAASASSDVNSTPNSSTATQAKPAPKHHPSPAKTSTPVLSSGTYTVAAGDTLWDLSKKFGTSIRQLKKLNHLTKDRLRPGQVLKVPGKKSTATRKPVKKAKTVAEATYRHAEPVQDFDLPASTFASCPVPIDSGDAPETTADNPSPLAPSSKVKAPQSRPALASATVAEPLPDSNHRAVPSTSTGRPSTSRTLVAASPGASKPVNHGFFNFFYSPPPTTVDWGARFTQAARELGDEGISYNADWCPPGESHSWTMDCSNTTRYLYKTTTGIQLPRTASDQYYYLHLQNKAWDVPQLANGFADTNYLRQNLKAGDLLFWENTYKPDRQPPITHVMIFLGSNARGEWIMAGSQSSRGGEHNRRHGGPDIYVFNPSKPCGGYRTWLGLVHHQGKFCAFGRPLEADKAKLAVAAND
jgi:LysM repeat protein